MRFDAITACSLSSRNYAWLWTSVPWNISVNEIIIPSLGNYYISLHCSIGGFFLHKKIFIFISLVKTIPCRFIRWQKIMYLLCDVFFFVCLNYISDHTCNNNHAPLLVKGQPSALTSVELMAVKINHMERANLAVFSIVVSFYQNVWPQLCAALFIPL